MRRVVVRVDEQDGWQVSVRVPGLGGALVDLVPPYRMDRIMIGPRQVPITPPDRLPAAHEPHATLCAGDREAITELLSGIRSGSGKPDNVSRYGRWLFECLLAPAWPAICADQPVGGDGAVEIALRWPVDSCDLHRLVWEAMHDGIAPLAALANRVIAITRLVPAPVPDLQTITGIPRALFATSVKLTDPTIRPGAMFMGLLRGFDASGRCRARAVQAVSDEDLGRHCAEFVPDLVHIVAHGVLLDDGRGALMLRGDNGSEKETDATALMAALTTNGTRPKAVILSACNTGSAGESASDPTDAAPLAAELVAAGIPVVSAMAGEIGESACRLYTRRLADAVHEGQPVVAASAHGRRAALVANVAPSANIDWALPSLYLAEDLDPTQPMVDPTRANLLVKLANVLRLRQDPVFIGRQDILDMVDQAMDPTEEIGVVAVLSSGATSRLGGTRLLQEIGWRLLRAGHMPVLLGPYAKKPVQTTFPRGMVYEILRQIVTITEHLEVDPFVPYTLAETLGLAGYQAAVAKLADLGPVPARGEIRADLIRFRDNESTMDAEQVRGLLAGDLATLAELVADYGEPFGPHTRVVLLCDDVHAWAPPISDTPSGLDCLLGMLSASGLGQLRRPVPVILTGSRTVDCGRVLEEWCSNTQPWLRVSSLGELAADEAVLGYQWVLLHPWTKKPIEDRGRFGHIYTGEPTKTCAWEEALREVGGRPTSVEGDLYLAAVVATKGAICRQDDDMQAWIDYTKNNPGYGL